MTATPLVLFGAAAARIPLSTLGLLQYLTPTLQLLIGVFVLGETVDGDQLIGFALVWAALVLLTVAMLRGRQEPARLVVDNPRTGPAKRRRRYEMNSRSSP